MAGPFHPVAAGTFVPGGPQTQAVEILAHGTETESERLARLNTVPGFSPLPARALSYTSQGSACLASPVTASGLTQLEQSPYPTPVEEPPTPADTPQEPPQVPANTPQEPPQVPANTPQEPPKAPAAPAPHHHKTTPKAAAKANPQPQDTMYTDGTYWQSHGYYRFLLFDFSS